jgi:hypothetical protein
MRPDFRWFVAPSLAVLLAVAAHPQSANRHLSPDRGPLAVRFQATRLLPLTALAKLSAQTGVPMGVEWVGPGEGAPISCTWANAGVVSIAEQILKIANGKWAYHGQWDGSTLLLRPAARILGAHSVLDIRLPSFSLYSERPAIASRLLSDAIHRNLLGQPPPKTFTWSGGFSLDVPVVSLTHTFRNEATYRIMDWIAAAGAAAGAESFWLVEDLPKCRIGPAERWCTYTYFGIFRKPARQPLWALLPWRTDPMNVTNPLVVRKWPCVKCPARPKPPDR